MAKSRPTGNYFNKEYIKFNAPIGFFGDSNNWGNVKITPLCSRHFLALSIYYLWWCDNLGRWEVNQSVFITIFSCVTTGKLKSAGKWVARCLRNYQSVNYQGVKISVEAISLDFKQTVASRYMLCICFKLDHLRRSMTSDVLWSFSNLSCIDCHIDLPAFC